MNRLLLVTASEALRVDLLSLDCWYMHDKFDEAKWEAGLREILGSEVVDDLKQHKAIYPGATFQMQVDDWINR